MNLRQLAGTFDAFADPTRLRILSLLAAKPGINVSALTEALNIPQSSVSRALAMLRNTGVVQDERSGRFVFYHLAEGSLLGDHELPELLRKAVARTPELRDDLKRLNAVLRGD